MTPLCHPQPAERSPTPCPNAALPFISVLVPIRNEERYIEQTLAQLLAQDYDPGRFEILVADGASTDATPQLVRWLQGRHPQVRLLSNPKRWSSAGRNVAVRASRGDLLVLVDGHCELDNPRYLRDLAAAFDRSGAECVGRPQPLDVTGATPLQRAIAAARSSWLGHNPGSHIYSSQEGFVRPQSVAIAYRREVFDQIGLFDESFDACEDVEFNQRVERAGFRCFFTQQVRIRYHPRGSLGGVFRQLVRYGRGRVRLLRKHPETFTVPCFAPAALVLSVVAGLPLAWLSPWLVGAYVGALGVYVMTVALVSLALAVRAKDMGAFLWLPLVFAAIHAGAGSGILVELLAGRRPAVGPSESIPLGRPATPGDVTVRSERLAA